MTERSDAGARTEEPTPRRLAQARLAGEVAASRELVAAAGVAAMFVVLALGAPAAVGRLAGYLRAALAAAGRTADDGAGTVATGALAAGLGEAAAALTLVLGVGMLAAVAVGLALTRALFTLRPLRVDLARAVPQAGRLANRATLFEVAKGTGKLLLFALVAWWTMAPVVGGVVRLTGTRAGGVLAALGTLAWELGLWLVVASAAVALLDQLWQRRLHRQRLRMTREEVRRDVKETEGDPLHKAERQRLHRELLEQRMLSDVRKADFVVVNPEHIAVALRYDRDGDAAPVVVARGERLLAERIKELAREAGVPIFRDVNLAQALRGLEAGEEIPEALYEAVAEILRVVHGAPPPPAQPPPLAPPPAAVPGPAAPGWRRA